MKEAADISVQGASATDAMSDRLQALLEAANQPPVTTAQHALFASYLHLILRWNARMNLTAIRSEEGILSRHFVESIVCARAIPNNVKSLLDFGSGAGFPGVPIAICRPEIAVTLAESQGKKAAFLLSAAVYHGRAEGIGSQFDCVVLRAVDSMEAAVATAAGLVSRKGVLALMTTEGGFPGLRAAAGPGFTWGERVGTAGSESLFLALGRQSNFPARGGHER
jgi:16S rRNA (guanine527-N7)-methyltransferase